MSAIGIEHISNDLYRIYRFRYKAQRDKWITQKPGRRKATQSTLDKYLGRKAKEMMISSGNDCVRVIDNRRVKREKC